MVQRQMGQRRNAPCPQSVRGRWTQELWCKADLDVPSYWPRGCERTGTGKFTSALGSVSKKMSLEQGLECGKNLEGVDGA